ncbi:MAG: zinc ABC transporter substrate-binding protein [Muribaculaceae bacterium]|nr:zinc ABC transporter substrate-binding protein [Muribaculaceae bacterium]
MTKRHIPDIPILLPQRCLTAMLCAILCLLCSCTHSSDTNVLTVSIPPQKWLLDSIVGDRFTVVSMLKADSNPETFEPSMHQLMNLQASQAYFTVGNLAFELTSLPKIQENFPSLQIVDSSAGINVLTDGHAASAGTDHDHAPDPHVWTSLLNARIMAKNMYEKVIALDPEGKDYYTTRYKDLDTNLAALDDSVKTALSTLKGRAFVVWHPSLSYFARDYGLVQTGLETTGKETSVAQYKQRIEQAGQPNALIFFTQAEFDSREADVMAKELGIPTTNISLMQPDIAAQIRFLTHALTQTNH